MRWPWRWYQCDAHDEGQRCWLRAGHRKMHERRFIAPDGGLVIHRWSGRGAPPLDARDYEIKGPDREIWGPGEETPETR